MTSPIRSKRINQPECIPPTQPGCWEPRNSFYIEVEGRKAENEAKPYYVHIYNLDPHETLHIERVYGDNCDPLYAPLRRCGELITMDCLNDSLVLTIPGKYRFSTASGNEINNDDFAVEYSPIHADYAKLWIQQCCCN